MAYFSKWLIVALSIFCFSCSAPLHQKKVSRPMATQKSDEERGISVKERMRESAVSRKVGRWAVVVGISDYKFDIRWNPRKGIPDLYYADSDARAFSNFLKSPEGGAFSPERVLLLTNREATVKEVRKAIGDFLAQSLENDLVIIFFAGHGAPDPKNSKNLYLLCYDTEPGNFYGTALPMWEIDIALSRTIQSKRVIVLADACHSAGVGGTRSIGASNNFNQYMAKLANSREGLTEITASRSDELSMEKKFPEGGHGLFTHYLLKGLRGEADENKDGFVTMKESYAYLYDKVRSESRHSQNPWASAYVSSDIPLGILDKDVIQEIESQVKADKAKPKTPLQFIQSEFPKVDIPKDSNIAVKLAQAKLDKDEKDSALGIANAVIARNDQAEPDALSMKIKILLGYDDLRAAEDTEDLLVIPYPNHPASTQGARFIFEYYMKQVENAGPEETLRKLSAYLKRHPRGPIAEEAKKKSATIQANLKHRYQRSYDEQLALASGYMSRKRFDKAQDALYLAESILRKSNDGMDLGINQKNLSELRNRYRVEAEKHRDFLAWSKSDQAAKAVALKDVGEYNQRISIYKDFASKWPDNPFAKQAKAETQSLTSRLIQFKDRKFNEYIGRAKDYFIRNDYTKAYESLELAKKYGTQTQQTKISALSKQYNAPPEVKIDTSRETAEWETPVKFNFTAADKENDPVRVISWDFGDGSTSREKNPEHQYAKWQGSEKQKTYKVILKTTDGNSTAVARKTIVINRQDCVARDGKYCQYSTGVVKDTSTGLEWYVGPDRRTKWHEAKAWVEKLNVAGGGWRMPTKNELKALYQKGAGTRNMTPLLKTTGWWVWSGETKGSSSAWFFNFNEGYVFRRRQDNPGYEFWLLREGSPNGRGFAVRSRK